MPILFFPIYSVSHQIVYRYELHVVINELLTLNEDWPKLRPSYASQVAFLVNYLTLTSEVNRKAWGHHVTDAKECLAL